MSSFVGAAIDSVNQAGYSDTESTGYAAAMSNNTYNPFNQGKTTRDVLSTLQNQSYNSAEAQKNRDWQEYMSNSAHQREVEDLKKAGLNTWNSAGGGGASTPSGAVANSAVAAKANDYAGPAIIGGLSAIAGAIIKMAGHPGAAAAVGAAGKLLSKNASSGKQASNIMFTTNTVKQAVSKVKPMTAPEIEDFLEDIRNNKYDI